MSEWQTFEAGNVRLDSGITLMGACLAYQTYGRLNADRSNAIFYPCSFGADHRDLQWLIGPGQILDSDRWFVVIPNMLGNGLSTSPSNVAPPLDRGRWPGTTVADNVRLQHRLATEVLGLDRLAMVYGFSMGALQAYHWAALFPKMVERIVVNCGAARTARHNFVFLDGIKAVLQTDPAYRNGWFAEPPVQGLRAFARVYAGWGLSQEFYRERLYETALGYASLEDFLVHNWEASFLRRDANNLLAQIHTWQQADIAANPLYQGDLTAALRAIEAKVLLMPSTTDLYFRVADNEAELPHLRHGILTPIPTVWGHRAGNPALHEPDRRFVAEAVAAHLAR